MFLVLFFFTSLSVIVGVLDEYHVSKPPEVGLGSVREGCGPRIMRTVISSLDLVKRLLMKSSQLLVWSH